MHFSALFNGPLFLSGRGPDLMMHHELQIDVHSLGPLLSSSAEKELLDMYVTTVSNPYFM